MTAFATFSGVRAVAAHVAIPTSGIWTAEVHLDSPTALSGAAVLVLGDQTFRGHIYRGGPYQGASSYLIEGGAGGWRSVVPAQGYRSLAGVRLRTVLEDAARAAGETLDGSYADRSLGTAWARQRAPASRVLAELLGRSWYVGLDGVTRIGTRTGVDVTAQYDVISHDPAERSAVIATETPSAFTIGSVLRLHLPAPMRIGQIETELSATGLRLRILGGAL